MPLIVTIIFLWFVFLTGLGIFLRGWLLHRRMQERIFTVDAPDPLADEEEQGWFSYWLYTAGYRSPSAATAFVLSTLLLSCVGIALAMTTYYAGAVDNQVLLLTAIPGGVGEILLPLAYGSPFVLVILFGAAPWLMVRTARQKRIRQFEEDLPLMLDLLSTLAQAGLGFDAALDRVLDTVNPNRVLVQEFRAFQRDILAGRARIDALRRLGRRVNLSWFSAFISAVVQAEQIGAGLADVLRVQADDLRDRRREQALALAMQIPVKLLAPLIICFMPGLMVAALGPTFFELFQFLDSFTQSLGS